MSQQQPQKISQSNKASKEAEHGHTGVETQTPKTPSLPQQAKVSSMGPPIPQTATDFEFEVGTSQATAQCKHCHQEIPPGELRICRTKNPNESLHFNCIFMESEGYPLFSHQIKGVESLSPHDRAAVIRKITSFAPSMKMSTAASTAGVVVEYARSMEAECAHCGEPIAAPGEIRVGLLEWRQKTHVLVPQWHHLFCLFRRRDFADLSLEDVRQFSGYKRLEPHGQELVMRLIEAHKRGFLKTPKAVKRKREQEEEDTSSDVSKESSESAGTREKRRLPGERRTKRRRVL